MSMNAYCGLMGSGKSYEAVLSVILPAVKAGRRVVTNIDGVNEKAIHEYLVGKGLDREKLGTIVHVTNERITEPNFFPPDPGSSNAKEVGRLREGMTAEETADAEAEAARYVVRPGDLVVIDEAWRFWAKEEKLSEEHMTFFRMHRHYVDQKTGVCCDIALILQSITDLHRRIKSVIEMTCYTHKHKTLGQPDRYLVQLYEGSNTRQSSLIDSFQKKYNPEIFPLYASYSGPTDGKEKAIDKRQNILTNKKWWWYGAGLVALGSFAVYSLSGFYHMMHPNADAPSKAAAAAASASASASSPSRAMAALKQHSPDPKTADARIEGVFSGHAGTFVLIRADDESLHFEPASAFAGVGYGMAGSWKGKPVLAAAGPLFPDGGGVQRSRGVLP